MTALEQEVGRVLVQLGLAVWIGGGFLVRRARSRLDPQALAVLVGLLDQARYGASAVVLAGIVLEVDADPWHLSGLAIARMAAVMLLAATHLYTALLVAPRRHLAATSEVSPAAEAGVGALDRRAARLEVAGLALAVAAVLLG